ncbi:MAG: hypothetical protein CM1200mP35_10640 [Chloroflexota bacterium]|nr:MAG: hypothetical protein CM1200mP35_10640 [Chloroflexota bacterium]
MHWQTHKVAASHYRSKSELNGTHMEVAVAWEETPQHMARISPLPPDLDEMMLSGFIRDEGVEMVKAKTVALSSPSPCGDNS